MRSCWTSSELIEQVSSDYLTHLATVPTKNPGVLLWEAELGIPFRESSSWELEHSRDVENGLPPCLSVYECRYAKRYCGET